MTEESKITCQDVLRRVRSGGDVDDDMARHAEGCDVCAELVDSELTSALERASSQEERPAASFAALTAEIETSSGWRERLMELSRTSRVGLMAAVGALMCALVAATKLRPDWAVYPTGRMIAVLGLFGVGSIAVLLEALRPLYRPARPSKTTWAVVAAVVAAGVAVAALPIAHTSDPAALRGIGDMLIPGAAKCLAFGCATGVPILLIAAVADRVRPPRWSTTLLAASAAGLVGNAVLQLHCPVVHQEHLLLGHATVTVVLIGINALLYRWLA